MKRAFVLLVLIALVVWLATAKPETRKNLPPIEPPGASASAVAPPLDCGGGCDPDGSLEWSCIYNGGYWDPYSCTCDFGCDPTGSQEWFCLSGGGIWDPFSCYCQQPSCDPGPEVTTYESSPYN